MRTKREKRCVRQVRAEKRIVPGAPRTVRRCSGDLKLRNYLLEVHPEFEPRVVDNSESVED
jgi:hypothetical protein